MPHRRNQANADFANLHKGEGTKGADAAFQIRARPPSPWARYAQCHLCKFDKADSMLERQTRGTDSGQRRGPSPCSQAPFMNVKVKIMEQ